jgi:hypothetical protein
MSTGARIGRNDLGDGTWRAEYTAWLRGADVVLLPDDDEAGRKHADQIVGFLGGVAKRIGVLPLPSLPEKEDIADWVALGGTATKFGRQEHKAVGALTMKDRGSSPRLLFWREMPRACS